MGGERRNLLLRLLAAAIAVAAVLMLVVVGRSPHRNDLATYWGFVAGVVAIAAPLIIWVLRQAKKQEDGTPDPRELDQVADQLADAVGKQWEGAARERGLLWPEPIPVHWRAPSEAMVGPVAAAVGSTRFSPLPGLRPIEAQDIWEGNIGDLHAVYGGLGSGRLVVAGAPGSGKTGAAVLLVLAALRLREQVLEGDRDKVPVPVMFTLHGWAPDTQKVEAWLATQLRQTYPLFTGTGGAVKAAQLVAKGRISVILDGLDEIPERLRPVALEALTHQASFRVVLLTRSAEMASAARSGLLEGAAVVELQPVGCSQASAYLTHVQLDPPPDGWRELINRIRRYPISPLARALSSPLALTLVRDTYRREDDVRELIAICDGADAVVSSDQNTEVIVDHLLDRVLPAAYGRKPGDTAGHYSLQKAQVALRHIAARMNRDGTGDLQWWRMASWAAVTPSVIATGVIFGASAAFVAWIVAGITTGFAAGASAGAAAGLSIGVVALFAAMIATGGKDRPPKRLARIRWRRIIGLPSVLGGALVGIGVAIFGDPSLMESGNLKGIHRIGSGGLAVAGVMAGVAAGLVFGLMRGISYPGTDSASPLTPKASWRSDRAFRIVRGLVGGIVVGLAFGLAFALAVGPRFGLTVALIAGPLYGLVFGVVGALVVGPVTSSTWEASLAFVQLAVRWRTPVRLMRFLEDARERGVLRTVGPVYQFRHARLQNRLAEQASPPVSAQDSSKATAV